MRDDWYFPAFSEPVGTKLTRTFPRTNTLKKTRLPTLPNPDGSGIRFPLRIRVTGLRIRERGPTLGVKDFLGIRMSSSTTTVQMPEG